MPREDWKYVNVRPSVYEQLEKKAEAEGRSVANFLETTLIKLGVVK